MAVESYLPTLGTVIITAAIDSINPCAIGVLVLMLSIVLAGGRNIPRMLFLGLLYISSIFLVYIAAGLGLIYFLHAIPLAITEYLSISIGTLIVGAGIVALKDYFWYGRGFSLSIPIRYIHKLEKKATRAVTAMGVVALGVFVALVELPCTGAPYLAIITLLSQYFDFTALLLLILYNFIFVLPLIVILFLVAGGKSLYEIKKWKDEKRPIMRLALGLLLIAMGWLLILIANGTINFG